MERENYEQIQPSDILIFAGDTNQIVDLEDSKLGLIFPKPAQSVAEGKVDVVEAVVSSNSSLIGRMVKRTGFRNLY